MVPTRYDMADKAVEIAYQINRYANMLKDDISFGHNHQYEAQKIRELCVELANIAGRLL